MMPTWRETFQQKSKAAKAARSAFGADDAASPAVVQQQATAKGLSTGWTALLVMGAVYAGYEYGVRRLTKGAVR